MFRTALPTRPNVVARVRKETHMAANRKEYLEEMRAVKFLCRSPLPAQARELVDKLLKRKLVEPARLLDRANRGRKEGEPIVTAIRKEGDPNRPDLVAYFSDGTKAPYRELTRCNFDVKQIILAGPFDGELHTYTCPNCGRVGVYRNPFFEE